MILKKILSSGRGIGWQNFMETIKWRRVYGRLGEEEEEEVGK